MICIDSNGQAIEISVADQMWLDDAYFKEKQMRLEPDAPRAALAYRVSTKGQGDHENRLPEVCTKARLACHKGSGRKRNLRLQGFGG